MKKHNTTLISTICIHLY